MFEFFDQVKEFLTSGIYEFFVEAGAWLVKKAISGFYDYVMWALEFGWDIAKVVVQDMNISARLNTAFSSLPPEIADKVRYFRIPEAIVNLISALITRFVIHFLPGL